LPFSARLIWADERRSAPVTRRNNDYGNQTHEEDQGDG
jgi:hypothetical protein